MSSTCGPSSHAACSSAMTRISSVSATGISTLARIRMRLAAHSYSGASAMRAALTLIVLLAAGCARLGQADDAATMSQLASELTYLSRSVDAQLLEEPAVSRSEEHTSELESLMRISYADFCLKTKTSR